MKLSRLLLLTDREQLPSGRDLVETVAACAAVGVRTVVLRELDLDRPARARLAEEMRAHVQVIAARRPLPGAVAVHLAGHQRVVDRAGRPHGRSCHHEDEVARAVSDGATYVTISPVLRTASKPGHGPQLGARGVRRAVAVASGVPVYALGGVDAASVADLRAAGAHGVAVMGAVMRAPDPGLVVGQLLAELELS